MSGFVFTFTVVVAQLFCQLKSRFRTGAGGACVYTPTEIVWLPKADGTHVIVNVVLCPLPVTKSARPLQPVSSERIAYALFALFVPSLCTVMATGVGLPSIARPGLMSVGPMFRSGHTWRSTVVP